MRVVLPLLVTALMMGGCAAPAAPAGTAPASVDPGPTPSLPDAAAETAPTTAVSAENPAPDAGTRWARNDVVSDAGDKVTWLVSFAEQVPATQVPDLGYACVWTGAQVQRALALPVTVTVTVNSAMPVSLAPFVQIRGGTYDLLFSPDERGNQCQYYSTRLPSQSVEPGSSLTSTFWLLAEDAITPNEPAGDMSRLAGVSLDVALPGMRGTVHWSGPLATGCTNGQPAVSLGKMEC